MRKRKAKLIAALLVICMAGISSGCTGTDKVGKEAEVSREVEEGASEEVKENDVSEAETETEENTDEDSAAEENRTDLLMDFLKGNGELVVSDGFTHANEVLESGFQAGDKYSFESLKEYLNEDENLSGTEPVVEYAYLEYPGRKAYALNLYYETDTEGFTRFFVLSEADGGLEMNFAIDGWSRRYPSINPMGAIMDSGSSGAGSHIYTRFVPDMGFEYKMLSDTEENAYGFSFYDPEDDRVETLNTIMNEVVEGNPDAMDVLYYRSKIDGKVYYYFLGGYESEPVTQEMVDYIDGIAAKYGFVFDGKASADEAELSYAKELGAEEFYDVEEEVNWISL